MKKNNIAWSCENERPVWSSWNCSWNLYMLPMSQIMKKKQIAYHSYADNTQLYLALSPNYYSPIDTLCKCIDEVNSWMCQLSSVKQRQSW